MGRICGLCDLHLGFNGEAEGSNEYQTACQCDGFDARSGGGMVFGEEELMRGTGRDLDLL